MPDMAEDLRDGYDMVMSPPLYVDKARAVFFRHGFFGDGAPTWGNLPYPMVVEIVRQRLDVSADSHCVLDLWSECQLARDLGLALRRITGYHGQLGGFEDPLVVCLLIVNVLS